MTTSRIHHAAACAAVLTTSVLTAATTAAHAVTPASRADATTDVSASGATDAPAAAIRFGDARLATGVRLHFAERGDAAGPAIIMLHGYSDSWASFARVLPLLPERLHVYALDQRGHGDSDRPASGYLMRDLAADVVAFMDAKGIARATVVGHSMGSFVAQQVALAAPTRVQRLVLIGSATAPRHIVGMSDLDAAVRAFPDPEEPAPVEFAREFQTSTVSRPVPAAFMDSAVAASGKLPARVWRALMDGMLATDVPTGLGAHRIPTLLMWGERDGFASREQQDALLRLLPGAQLTTYVETGHAPHWELPAEFADDLVRFVRDSRAARAEAGRRR